MQVNDKSEGETVLTPEAGGAAAAAAPKSGDVTQALRQVRQENKALKSELARLRTPQSGQPLKSVDVANLPKGEEFVADPEAAGKKVSEALVTLQQRLEAAEAENASLRGELQTGWIDQQLKKYPIYQDAEVGDDAQAALVLKLQSLPAGTPPEEAERVMRETASRFSKLRAGSTTQEPVDDGSAGRPPVPPAGGGAAAAALKTDTERPKNWRDARGIAERLAQRFFATRSGG